MHTIFARNVNEALPLGLQLVHHEGKPVLSRDGPTLEMPGPVATVYECPWENVLLDPGRDANPFFHLFEFAWILAGSRSVHLPAFFLPRIKDYSDNGSTFHGAYGWRLRNWEMTHKMFDQLEEAVRVLRSNLGTRQVVLSIWNPGLDLGAATKDVPCNDMIMFKVRDDKLLMTVCNRSNDVIWGAYGANAVQFSMLQMWVAARCGLGVGWYTQISDSYHVYTERPHWQKYASGGWAPQGHVVNPYHEMALDKTPDFFKGAEDATAFEKDCQVLVQAADEGILARMATVPSIGWLSEAMRYTLRPMLIAFCCHKAGDSKGAIAATAHIDQPDWRLACREWLERRA